MLNPPTTLEEARTFRYGSWAGNERGYAYDPKRCAYSVWDQWSWGGRQCSRSPDHGPDGLYCWQHAQKVKAKEE